MVTRLTIGELALASRLSIRMLRRHHATGVLVPDEVDEHSGYRYYSPDQVEDALLVKRLRDLDVPVADVRRLLATSDPGARAALLADHVARLEERVRRTRAAIVEAQRMIAELDAPLAVDRRRVPATTVAGLSTILDHAQVPAWFPRAEAELRHVTGSDAALGAVLDDALYSADRGRLTLHVASDEPPRDGRVEPLELPAADLVVALHVGPRSTIDVTHGRLSRRLLDEGLRRAGPTRQTYLVGLDQTSDESTWRTEVAVPVVPA